MSRLKDTSLFWSEDEQVLNDNDTHAWFEPVFPEVKEDYIEEENGTAYFEKKKEEFNTDTPVEPEPVDIGMLVRDYENWEGRVVSAEDEIIRARIINTQRIYSPRIMQISRSVFVSKGVKKELSVGDMFELTFKHVKKEFQTKDKKLTQREENIDMIRLIEQTYLTREEIDELVSKELQSLSYLFE